MEDFNLKTELPAISFDYDRLKKWAEDIAEQYTGVVVREEDVAAIKNEMAALNKVKSGLNEARIATVKQVSVPIRAFEEKVKGLVKIIDDARTGLDVQVKAYEQAERDQKRKAVEFMLEELKTEHDVQNAMIPFDEAWTNKTTTMKSVKAQIEARILEHIRREREQAQLEQAKKDRAVAIEQNCKALENEFGTAMQPSSFIRLQSLDVPLAEVNDQMRQAFQKAAAKASANKPAPRRMPAPMQRTAAPAPTASAKHSLTLTLEYQPEQKNAVRATLNGLRGMGVLVHVHEVNEAA